MLNQEIHPPYQPVDDLDGLTNSQDSMDGEGEDDYEDEEALEQVEFTKIKRENVFTPIDFTRRKAKIIVTLGPASSEVKDLVRLMDAGMNMARINLSHGTQKQNIKLLNRFKQAKRLRPHKTVGLMLEARGREIRLNQVADPSGEVTVKAGSVVHLNTQNSAGRCNDKTFFCNNDSVQRYLKPNDVVYFDDGKVIGVVMEILNDGCMLEMKMGGTIPSNCQLRFTGGKHDKLAVLSQKDVHDFQAISREI